MPTITSGSSQRAAPIDRNPAGQTQRYAASAVAPHGATTRWTYTTPAAKKDRVQELNLAFHRQTVGAPVGEFEANIQYTPNGGTAVYLLRRRSQDNTTTLYIEAENATQLDMLVGDNLLCQTADGSTGGTVAYNVSAVVFDYDA